MQQVICGIDAMIGSKCDWSAVRYESFNLGIARKEML